MNKFNDILEQFAREIEQTADIFERNKDTPPVTKNQPPVAGAIKWVRSLLERLKRTMAKLLSTEEVRRAGAPRPGRGTVDWSWRCGEGAAWPQPTHTLFSPL